MQPNVVNPYTVPAPVERTLREPTKPAKRSMMPFLLGVVVVAALGGAAFWFASSSDDEGDELASSGPGAAVLTTFTAMADRDYEAACASISSTAKERLTTTGSTCESELERINPGNLYAKADDSKILKVVVKGNRAQLNVEVGGSPVPDLPIGATREDGVWKTDLGSFGPAYVDPQGEWKGVADADEQAEVEAEAEAQTNDDASDGDPADDPGAAFLAWVTAVRAKDWETACKFTASHTIETWAEKGWSCVDTYAAPDAMHPYLTSNETTVSSTRKTKRDVAWVDATMSMDGDTVESHEYRMQLEDGLWKYDSERTWR